MSKEWHEKLYEKYGYIFEHRIRKPGQKVILPMQAGLCVGDGWQTIIETLCYQLDQYRKNYGVITRAQQVKEKFGGLRFYSSTEVDPETIKVEKRWWADLLEWFIAWRHWWWEPRFMDKWRMRRMSLWRRNARRYLQFKNGGTPLRNPYYVDFGYAVGKVSGAVSMAEAMSYCTCEQCGQPGKCRGDRAWVVTLCDDCVAAEKQENRGPVAESADAQVSNTCSSGSEGSKPSGATR